MRHNAVPRHDHVCWLPVARLCCGKIFPHHDDCVAWKVSRDSVQASVRCKDEEMVPTATRMVRADGVLHLWHVPCSKDRDDSMDEILASASARSKRRSNSATDTFRNASVHHSRRRCRWSIAPPAATVDKDSSSAIPAKDFTVGKERYHFEYWKGSEGSCPGESQLYKLPPLAINLVNLCDATTSHGYES